MIVLNWIKDQALQLLMWLAKGGTMAIIHGAGSLSRFLIIHCSDVFVLFGTVGLLIAMVGLNKQGNKMLKVSIVAYILVQVLGATL